MNNLKKKIVYLSLLGLLATTGTVALASEGRRGGELRRSDDDGVRQRVLRVRDLERKDTDDRFDDHGGLRGVRGNQSVFEDNSGRSERTIFDDNSGRRTDARSIDDSGRHGDDFGLRKFDDNGGRR